jgi:hypothetical protein
MGRSSEFEPRFEGRETLDGLLELCGALVDTEQALHAMREAHAEGHSKQEVIPSFFEGEPKPPSPEIARKLFQNLLGLWELVETGKKVPLDETPQVRVKKTPPSLPEPFGEGVPSEEFVDQAWKYLEGATPKDRSRLMDAFENRQDTLVSHLDDSGLSDEGYATARQLCFEVFAMLELGTPRGTRAVRLEELTGKTVRQDAPPSLTAYVDEALYEAQHDEEQPLSPEEAAGVRERVMEGLVALWNARR